MKHHVHQSLKYFKNYLDNIDVGSGEDFCFWIKKGNSYIYDSGLNEDRYQ